ncbi:hypothetical protein ACLKA6_007756 [Drosophila palustris]
MRVPIYEGREHKLSWLLALSKILAAQLAPNIVCDADHLPLCITMRNANANGNSGNSGNNGNIGNKNGNDNDKGERDFFPSWPRYDFDSSERAGDRGQTLAVPWHLHTNGRCHKFTGVATICL